jgi:MFS family permease
MINPRLLFFVSVLALATAGIHFGIRSSVAGDISKELFEPYAQQNSGAMIGAALGVASLGFAISVGVGSPLLDLLGMGRLLALSSLCFITGTLVVVNAKSLGNAGEAPYSPVYFGMAIVGLGWGLVETVINPLAAALYVDEKTHKMNVLHAWWPGGIIIGGLVGLALEWFNASWQTKLYCTILPAAAFGIMCLQLKFPPTERAAKGISMGEMFSEIFKRPFFLVWFAAMFLTASSELAPGQWVDLALSRTVGMRGIVLLIYVSGLMFVMRHFAGPLAHKLSPVGLLWFSCLLASAGLYALSVANSPVTGLLAATLWGTGVCYMWPTMLGITSERFPRGGSLFIGLMGTAGNLAIYLVLPKIGAIFDEAKVQAAGGKAAFDALAEGPAKEAVLAAASQASFRFVATLPAVLLLVFGAIWLYDRSRGGYKPEKL